MNSPSPLAPALLNKLAQGGGGTVVQLDPSGAVNEEGLEVQALHEVTKTVGYLKYLYANGLVLLRGQAKWYPDMEPSLYRGVNVNRRYRDMQIGSFVAECAPWTCDHRNHNTGLCGEKLRAVRPSQHGLLSGGTPRYAAEPLLQHYGVKTRWLDAVDNVWVALWFACHTFARSGRFIHVVRRTPAPTQEFAYLHLTILPGPLKEELPGLFTSPGAGRVVDLRRAVPSFYLRPHAQHAWLIHPHSDDVRNLMSVTVRIPLELALGWLGDSLLLSAFGIYPPASVDIGYQNLLKSEHKVPIPEVLGQLDLVGPGY